MRKTFGVILSAALCATLYTAPLQANEFPQELETDMITGTFSTSASERFKQTEEEFDQSDSDDSLVEEEGPVQQFKKDTWEKSMDLADSFDSDILHEAAPAKTPAWKERRKYVQDTTKFPYQAIAKLRITFIDRYNQEQTFVGTAFFISPTELLTCAHCIYDRIEDNGYGIAARIQIEPARTEDKLIYPSYDSDIDNISYSLPRLYTEPSLAAGESFKIDYAVLKIEKPVTGRDYIRLNSPSGNGGFHMSGYPANAMNKYNVNGQYEDWSSKSLIDSNIFLEGDIIGSGGQSGSPTMNNRNQAIGLYGYGVVDNETKQNLAWGGGIALNFRVLNDIMNSFDGNHNIEQPVYRVYNPNSGEHVFTADAHEVSEITKVGWIFEGIAWRNYQKKDDATPAYRLYNPNAGDHHYTSDNNERKELVKLGWKDEGVIWYGPPKAKRYQEVYRLYNPNAKSGAHHFTTDKNEYDALAKIGWVAENKAFDVR